MRARVQKWGNSLALRVPKALAAELHLGSDSLVDLRLVDGALVVKPAAEPEYTLAALLAGVTDDNLHREIDTGPAVGDEAW